MFFVANNTIVLIFLFFFSLNLFSYWNKCLKVMLNFLLLNFLLSCCITFSSLSSYLDLINFFNSNNNVYIIYLMYVFIYFNSNKNISNFFILQFVLILYNDIYNYNSVYFFDILDSKNVNNINLLNGLMLIHPTILYFFYSFCILALVNYFSALLSFKKCFLKKEFYTTRVMFLIFFATILGCWWAEQELAWGGWWNWDFVEILAIIYILAMLKYIHTIDCYRLESCFKNIVFLIAIMIISICTVRFNLINSIHNFAVLDSQNQYCYYVYSIVIFCCFIFMNYVYYHHYNYILVNVFLLLCIIPVFLEFFWWLAVPLKIKNVYLYCMVIVYLVYVLDISCRVIFLILLQPYTNNFIFNFTLFSFFKFRFYMDNLIFWLHMSIFLFMVFTFNQIFLLKKYFFYNLNQIKVIKLNLSGWLDSIFLLHDVTESSFSDSKHSIFDYINPCNNFFADQYKNIPERKITFIKNSLLEFSNVDINVFFFPSGFLIPLSLIIFICIYQRFFLLKTFIHV